MISYSYTTDTQTKSTDLAATVAAASSPQQIAEACGAIESFLHKHTPDQARWFFSITFPTLICRVFGFDESSTIQKPRSPNGWVDVVVSSNDSELAGRVFNLLSPNGALMSTISAVDRLSLVKYVFPPERLPEWVRLMLQSERDGSVLADLCPFFKGRVKEDTAKGSFQVQLNVFEYYIFWFAYYPVCRGNTEACDTVTVRRSRKFRLENWANSIPGFSNAKRGTEQKMECNLYIQLLYAYLRAFVPLYDLNACQPYRSSLLHYSSGYDNSIVDRAEFFVNTLIHFWLVDNDFSPLPVSVCKSFGVAFPSRTALGETPPTSGLAEIVNVFVKYLNFVSFSRAKGSDQAEPTGSPKWSSSGSDTVRLWDAFSELSAFRSVGSWNSWIQRPLYRFILRTFLFCPVEASVKNVSPVLNLWMNWMEPWTISFEEFTDLDARTGVSTNDSNDGAKSPSRAYSASWQGFVLTNYLFYSSLVMHFIGFAHKFLHTDAEAIVQMVSKVLSVLTSSKELMDLIKDVYTVFHSKPSGSSKSMLNNLYRFVPAIREQLQDWEDGLCERDADGSFLHENWNKDLKLFSDGEDGGQQLLQLFLLRAESELQSTSGPNLQCLDSLKVQLRRLFGDPVERPATPLPETRQLRRRLSDEKFKPRRIGHFPTSAVYKGDPMKRPVSSDEVAWLANLLVRLSARLNDILGLGLGPRENGPMGPTYVDLSPAEVAGNVSGAGEFLKVAVGWVSCFVLKLVRESGFRVNLRALALKKAVTVLVAVLILVVLRRVLGI